MASTSRSTRTDDIPLELDELRDDSQLNSKPTIFLSHSGAQKAFVEQLYEDLKSRGQSPFFDQSPDCLPKGEVFASRIFKAAKQCAVAVVVLSKEFLESKWPMLELTAFVEAQKTQNPKLKLFPLFYKLEASNLKEPDIGRIIELWTKMADADDRIRPDVWKDAVQVLARANGEVFSKYGGSKVKYRKAIVDAVCRLCLHHKNRVPSMVGRERLCNIMEGEFEKLATKEGVRGARTLGLYGAGGMGKTFLCKALCDHFSDEYSGRVCHVEFTDTPISYLGILKLILEELTDIDEKALLRTGSEKQADVLLRRFLPEQNVFLALDNLQDDHLDWPLLTYLSPKSKVVVTSRSMQNVRSVVGSEAFCLPCPSLAELDALELFVRSAGCTQPPVQWANEEDLEILKNCIELSFPQNVLDAGSCRKAHGPHNSSMLSKSSSSAMGNSRKRMKPSSSTNESGSSERRGHYNPLVLVAMGTTIKGNSALEPMQLMQKCQRIEFLQQHERRPLSDVLRTSKEDLTADEKRLFLDVALCYPIVNLGDEEFVDHILDRVLKWLETVDSSPRSEILLKLAKLEDLNVSALNDHRKERGSLFYNIYVVLGSEGASIMSSCESNDIRSMPYFNKAIEILTLHKVSIEAKVDGPNLWAVQKLHANFYASRGNVRIHSQDCKGAVEDFLKADEYYPNHAYFLQLLGFARVGAGQHQEALEPLNRAIALYPTTEEGVSSARDNYANTFAVRGDVKRVLHDFVGAKLDLDFARALNATGMAELDGLGLGNLGNLRLDVLGDLRLGDLGRLGLGNLGNLLLGNLLREENGSGNDFLRRTKP